MAAERHILVLGGSGQLGRELLDRPWPDDVAVTAPPRSAVDLTDRAAVAALVALRPWTAVINAAAFTAVDAAEAAVAEAFALNALLPAILAEETRRQGAPLIHVSTDYVFDGGKPTPYVEEDPVRPLCVYGAGKLAGEAAVRTGNPRHLILRTSWLFGRFGRNFVKTMLRLAREGKTIRVVDDQHGTPTASADLAGAIATLVTSPNLRDLSGVYHFANAGEASWFGFARRIFALTEAKGGPFADVRPIASKDYPTAARRPANSRLATAKIAGDLGIAPRSWEEALAELLGGPRLE